MRTMQLSDQIHIVLVEPEDNRNIGAVARAMDNLGFSNLHLVRPVAYAIEEAKVSACWAVKLLESAKVHDSLDLALAPMQNVVGFTARSGKNRGAPLNLVDWAVEFTAHREMQTALLFGPEDTGLRDEHISRCRSLVRIPSVAENPSFNLAQAVLLALYELIRTDPPVAESSSPKLPLADWQAERELELKLDQLLHQSGFHLGDQSTPAGEVLKRIFRRVPLDQREMNIVLGFFSRLAENERKAG